MRLQAQCSIIVQRLEQRAHDQLVQFPFTTMRLITRINFSAEFLSGSHEKITETLSATQNQVQSHQ